MTRDFDISSLPTKQSQRAFSHFVVTAFCNAADEDYFSARLMWHIGHARGFAWSAAQALEKYIKCALLLNGMGCKFGHDFARPATKNKIKLVAGDLLPDQIDIPDPPDGKPRPGWPSSVELWPALQQFEKNGHPNGRYNEINIDLNFFDIHILDAACFALRRLSVDLDSDFEQGISWRKQLQAEPNIIFSVKTFEDMLKEKPEYISPKDALFSYNYSFDNNPHTTEYFYRAYTEAKAAAVLVRLTGQEYKAVKNIFDKYSRVNLPDSAANIPN